MVVRLILIIFSMSLSGFISAQSTPLCFQATVASFKKTSETSFSNPLYCNDIVLINDGTGEVTLISGSCTVYKILSRKYTDGVDGFLQIDTQDRNKNKVTFAMYAEIIDGFPKTKIIIIDFKNSINTMLTVEKKTMF